LISSKNQSVVSSDCFSSVERISLLRKLTEVNKQTNSICSAFVSSPLLRLFFTSRFKLCSFCWWDWRCKNIFATECRVP